MSNFMMNRIC